MSIQKARVTLKAKLRKGSMKLIDQTRGKESLLEREKFFPCESKLLEAFYKKRVSEEKICRKHPGMYNVVAYEKEWGIYPSALDFLDKNSENYHLKALEKKIYSNIMRPFLDRIPRCSNIIDAGGGIGRFAIDLARMGHKIQLVDSSKTALKKALKYFQEAGLTNFGLHLGDVANLSIFPDNSFDAALAIELICYCDTPEEATRELVRVTKENGLVVISVEGKYGGMLSDPSVSLDKIPKILKNDLLCLKDHLYVHYYTPNSLKNLLEKCGIEIINIYGSHYLTDGIFKRLFRVDKLDDKDYRKDVLNIEKLCREDPILKNFARAWVAVGRKR
jgi:ubiquinone/menaquinone biosynthesis C-methylase UbiE